MDATSGERRRLHELALFAGVHGGGILLRDLLRTVCYVEREAYAIEVLKARQEEGHIDAAPIWDDVSTFDPLPWRGVVDIVTGGFPCQDLSCAGKGEGLKGERSGLFFELIRIVRGVRPRFVFLENVPAITTRGLDRVLAELAESGFDAEWGCLSAAAVGAPHKRARWWCLAYCNSR